MTGLYMSGRLIFIEDFFTLDEYEDFMKYLVEPYSEFGGEWAC